MWTYKQSTGSLINNSGAVVGTGYSGNGAGLNNPASQAAVSVGPIPQGQWIMTEFVAEGDDCGLGVIHLDPAPGNDMAGRDGGFRIHGDDPSKPPFSASDGCIVYGHAADRQAIWDGGDHLLEVIQ